MKKLSAFLYLSFCLNLEHAHAQAWYVPNINNIHAGISVHGDLWTIHGSQPFCSFTTDTNKQIAGPGGLWLSGYDAGGKLHLAASTAGFSGYDYWPGILDARDTLTVDNSSNWDRLWVVRGSDIDYVKANPIPITTPLSVGGIYETILSWPGRSNRYAVGKMSSLTIPDDMAPFKDVNGNGIYEPLSGEYPAIKGDLTTWWTFSDNGPTHNRTNGKPLGVEIHAMSYGYKRGTLVDNIMYYEYTIVNKSSNVYHDFRIGLWNYPVLGRDSINNYIAFDSARRMAITYSANNFDGTPGGFGSSLPISAITMIVLPGDTSSHLEPAGSFTYYNNDTSKFGHPIVDTEYNNYMRSKLRNGQHFTNNFSGAGKPAYGFGAGADCNYVFPGDPANISEWSECVSNNKTNNRRYVLSSNDFTLYPGAEKKIVFAMITTLPDLNNGCPFADFTGIQRVADTAWAVYRNPPAPKPVEAKNLTAINSIKIYPNPANDKLFVEYSDGMTGDGQITVQNIIGQVMSITSQRANGVTTVDISKLPAGFYTLLYRNDNNQAVTRFVKE